MRNGSVVPELLEVFNLIAQHNLVLAMGHSSPQEVLHLLPIAREMGVENILVTHVFGQSASLEQMQQMASLGAILELDWLEVYSDALDIFAYVDAINTLGAENFLISSDFGQAGNPDHASGMRAFIQALRTAEINSAQIDLMARKNPAILLGLD
jgi:predicted metal-dependent phosphotriesterase family hydrolase